jgi:hypothetical protein
MRWQRMKITEIEKFEGGLGANIHGVDLSETLDAGVFSAIGEAWCEHLTLGFRGDAAK